MERIAISGSHGFLGSHLAERFNSEQIERLDRTGYLPEGLDVVFDIAAYGNLASQRKGAKEIYKANLWRVFTEINWLEDDTKFIYVSSSSVMRPKQNLYSLSKRAAEEYLQIQDAHVAIMRPFSITGVGDQEEHLIPTLIRSCLYGEEMPFVSEPHHDYVDVDDVVEALLAIKNNAQFVGEVYEVGRGISYSNREVLDRVEFVTGKKANTYEVDSMRDYDSKDWVSDNTRISTLGWRVRKTLTRSIYEMVKHERESNAGKL